MQVIRTLLLLGGVCAAMTVSAQAEELISRSEWRTLTKNKTLHLEKDGVPVGRMSFQVGQVFWLAPDGKCSMGFLSHRGGYTLYNYMRLRESDKFEHLRVGSEIMLKSIDTGEEFQVSEINDDLFWCDRRNAQYGRKRFKAESIEDARASIAAIREERLRRERQQNMRALAAIQDTNYALGGDVGPIAYGLPNASLDGLRIVLRTPEVSKSRARDVMRRICSAYNEGRSFGNARTIEILNTRSNQGYTNFMGVKACQDQPGLSSEDAMGDLFAYRP